MHREFPSKRCNAWIGGKEYAFDSHFEMHWARYLQFLKDQGEIHGWKRSPCQFDFREFGYRNKPYVYTPDFLVTELNGSITYHECKGYITTYDVSRMRRANKHFDAQFWLVLQRIPKKGKRSQVIAKVSDYVWIRRVVDGSKIIKSLKGIL